MIDFTEGDFVVCIDDSCNGMEEKLILNQVYEVKKIYIDRSRYYIKVNDLMNVVWKAERFASLRIPIRRVSFQ